MTEPAITVRPAVADDAAAILGFIQALADYEKAAHEVAADEAAIRASLFGEGATASALIAEADGRTVGFAVWFFNYSTWQGRNGLYLEDLFVMPEARGAGIGRALMQALARIALDNNCGRFEWSVLDWNEPAIRVYEALGAQAQTEWVRYRLEGDTLAALAAGAPTA